MRRLRTRVQRGKARGGRPDAKPDARADGLELAAQRDKQRKRLATVQDYFRYLEEVRPRLEIDRGVGTLFLTGYGEGFHPNALGYLIAKTLRAAGVKMGGSHLIRHTCAQHLLEGGADIRYIEKLLGHASLETTAIYTEMSVEALRRVYSACHPAETRWKEQRR